LKCFRLGWAGNILHKPPGQYMFCLQIGGGSKPRNSLMLWLEVLLGASEVLLATKCFWGGQKCFMAMQSCHALGPSQVQERACHCAMWWSWALIPKPCSGVTV
jgi:hypothetical protein